MYTCDALRDRLPVDDDRLGGGDPDERGHESERDCRRNQLAPPRRPEREHPAQPACAELHQGKCRERHRGGEREQPGQRSEEGDPDQ
jgi:hypothetical protein